MTVQTDSKNRVVFLDNLRYLMVLMVVVLHAAVSYSQAAPWWCVKDATSVFFDILMIILDVFLMPILFFIAGYFATPSILKNGFKQFIKAKFKRLGLPVLICFPIVTPLFQFIYHYRSSNVLIYKSFYSYWVEYMQIAGEFYTGVILSFNRPHQSHLWFISLLLLFFIMFGFINKYPFFNLLKDFHVSLWQMVFQWPFIRKSPSFKAPKDFHASLWQMVLPWPLYANQKKEKITKMPQQPSTESSSKSLLTFLVAIGIFSTIATFIGVILLATPYNPDPWVTIGNIFQFQPQKIVTYILCFCMGVYAFKKGWPNAIRIPGHPALWTAASFLLSLIMLGLFKEVMTNFSPGKLFFCVLARSFLCISFIAAFTSIALRYWNRPSRFGKMMASNSYYIYLVHFVIVILFQLLLSYWKSGQIFLKFIIVCAASILISLGISHYAIKPYPRLSVAGIYAIFLCLLIFIKF
ncbi:putative Acyltransferase family protein [Desulfamplus magnetovallimortis]|uniref:Putative Acyltransferase family protein n=1 Tax=Desulfamplus magnetovallimortis TaxID=1246637 RepID=A0A1W1H8S4_9BACT|nr:acyltransferase family protein [Desulfamplus magnetovallimortis]SLM28871.1 putative Acyltransferase family protein [Desulfamplus magnetovallimortis]